jgi:dipeptidyl aminopeptidase/acylaminoacyl peptidase
VTANPLKRLDLEQLLRVPCIEPYAGYELSPDGQKVAFSWNHTGQWELYELGLDQPQDLRQLTSGPGAKLCPRYSKDGKYLLYALDWDGSERFDIFVYDLARGVHRNLTPDTPESIQPNLSWSPDGEHIAYISNRSGRFSTYILPSIREAIQANTGHLERAVLVFDQSGPNWDVRWSPDGRRLAVTAESSGQDYATFIVNVPVDQLKASERVSYERDAPLPEAHPLAENGVPLDAREVCWSSDSSRLAFSSSRRGREEIGLFELETGRLTWVTSGAGEKSDPDWSPDGKRLAYVLSEGPDTWLAVHELSQDQPRLYQVESGVHFAPQFTLDDRRLVFAFDSPRRPDDLWQLDLSSGTMQPLTSSLPPGLSPDDFVMPEHIYYPSPDGSQVPALLYLPPGLERAGPDGQPPAVIVIHGGPNWLFQYLWYPFMSHLASQGWVVLAPNYRGSTGYGREWQLANRFEIGRTDMMDVVAGADYLLREGLADPDRIAVTGRSHGGYLTMCCLTQHPERWAAGSAVVPFLNWFTSHANSRQDLQHWDRENMGDPETNAALWRERSPYFYLDRVQAPVQLICGANDPRCPASESTAARDILLALGKPVDYVLYPDEGHTFLKIENVVDHELRRAAFLRRALER